MKESARYFKIESRVPAGITVRRPSSRDTAA